MASTLKPAFVPTLAAGLAAAAAMVPTAWAQETARIQALTAAYNLSGQQLFGELARKPANIVLSPYSIGTAMAMARAGARGDTEREMVGTLKHRLSREDTDAANAALLALLNGYDKTSDKDYCPAGTVWTGKRCEGAPAAERTCAPPTKLEGQVCVGEPRFPSAKLLIANALMLGKEGGLIAAPYRALVKEKYAGEIYERAGLAQINEWVKRKTEGKIERILDVIDPETAVVLLNAVYFKAGWAFRFPNSATREEGFNLSAAQKVPVMMMRQQASFRLVDRAGYRAIFLPYTQSALGMIVVLPQEVEGLGAVARGLVAGEVANLFLSLGSAPSKLVALSLPRFKTAFETDLVAPFKKAGMKLAFTDEADFSGMTGKPPREGGVKISQIKHRAVIEVMEEGTEAAAATAVAVVRTTAVRAEPIPFVVDRPFLFLVVDEASGAILFQGQIVDPRSA
jgi:serpin B